MITSPYEWKIFELDEKSLKNKQTNKQTNQIWWHSLSYWFDHIQFTIVKLYFDMNHFLFSFAPKYM